MDPAPATLQTRDQAGPGENQLRPLSLHALGSVASSFFGREQEVEAIARLIVAGRRRLVTLTGPGGVGKTRLVERVADRLHDTFEFRVVTVPLASIHQTSNVLQLVAVALDVPNAPNEHDTPLETRILSHIGDTPHLLVLDNLEHLPGVSRIVETLLAGTSRLVILATSRTPLRLSSEQLFPVRPLDLNTAAELFVDRAKALNPNFAPGEVEVQVIRDICARVDGLPLAVELAAARTTLFSPSALRARMSPSLAILAHGPVNAPDRQRTMRNAIAWSYDLLSPDEQQLFRALSVYRDGFSLDAAEAVCKDPGTCLDTLVALQRNSLVESIDGPTGEPRFRMLQTILEYASDALEAAGDADRARHAGAQHLLELAESAVPKYDSPELKPWRDRVEAEIDNCRSALQWCLDHAQYDMAVRLAGPLWRVWSSRYSPHDPVGRERATEGIMWLDRTLAHRDQVPVASQVEALAGKTQLYRGLGNAVAGLPAAEALLELAEMNDNPYARFWGHFGFGGVAIETADYPTATAHLEAAVALAPSIRDSNSFLGMALGNLAVVASATGEHQKAFQLRMRVMDCFRSCGNPAYLSVAAWNTSINARVLGDSHQAAELLNECFELYGRGGVSIHNVNILRHLTALALDFNRPDLAKVALVAVAAPPGEDNNVEQTRALAAQVERELARAAQGAPGPAQEHPAEPDLLEIPRLLASLPVPTAQRIEINHGLTVREMEVLRLLGRGQSNREIGEALFNSERTVQNHVGAILAKLDVTSRTQAALWAVQHGLSEPGGSALP